MKKAAVIVEFEDQNGHTQRVRTFEGSHDECQELAAGHRILVIDLEAETSKQRARIGVIPSNEATGLAKDGFTGVRWYSQTIGAVGVCQNADLEAVRSWLTLAGADVFNESFAESGVLSVEILEDDERLRREIEQIAGAF
ncbi:MAG: hypothetical protein KDA87_15285 [Planctomycetales bacterium]|nr:hypothetical protein [Planctomycetales bacterium]